MARGCDRTSELQKLFSQGRGGSGGGSADSDAKSAQPAPLSTEAQALEDLQAVVNGVEAEVGKLCRTALKEGSGVSDQVAAVSRLLVDTKGKVGGLRGHFAGLLEKAGKEGAAPAFLRPLLRGRRADSAHALRHRIAACDAMLGRLDGASDEVCLLAQTLRTHVSMVQRCADHRAEVRDAARRATASGAAAALRAGGVAVGGAGAGASTGDAAAAAAAAAAHSGSDAVRKAAAATSAALLGTAANPNALLSKFLGKPAAAEEEEVAAGDRKVSGAQRRVVQHEDAGAAEAEEEGEEVGMMESETLMAALKDETQELRAISTRVEEIASMSEVINSLLATQVDQVKEIETNASDTKSGVGEAQKHLQKATEHTWSLHLMLALAIFAMANTLVLFHMVRP